MTGQTPTADPYRSVAEQYVKLVLAVGQHDADYVDAFYGPAEWRTQAETSKTALVEIDRPADATVANLAALNALKNWTVDRLNEVEARRAQDRAAVRWLFNNIGNSVLRQTTGIIRYLFGWLDSTGGAR